MKLHIRQCYIYFDDSMVIKKLLRHGYYNYFFFFPVDFLNLVSSINYIKLLSNFCKNVVFIILK